MSNTMKKSEVMVQKVEATVAESQFVEEANVVIENRLVNEIVTITNQTRQTLLFNSIEIGRRLTEAKRIVKHGQWTKWLKERVDYSQRTANNFMKIYEQYGKSGLAEKSQSIADLSYTQALALLEVPTEQREEFAEKENAKDLTIKELQEKVKALTAEKQTAESKITEIEKKYNNLVEQSTRDLEEKYVEAEKLEGMINVLKKQAEEAEASKQKDLKAEIEKAIKSEQEKLKKVEAEKKRYQTELTDLKHEQKKAISQAREEERATAKLALEGKEKEIAKIKEDMQKRIEKATAEARLANSKLKEEQNKNGLAGDLAKAGMLIEDVLDGYANLMDILMSIKEVNKKEGEALLSDLENSMEKIRKKANIKLVVAK